MATSLRYILAISKRLYCPAKVFFSSSSKRLLLSEAYYCNEAWKAHLDEDPTINQVNFSDFAYQVSEQLMKTGRASAVDLNVFTHQFHTISENEVEFVEDILARFNLCQGSYSRNDSTSHSIVRGFLSSENGSRLTTLLTDRLTYGIFPNHYTLNLLMDWYIKQKDFSSAAKIAYCSMLQEDFSNPVNALLSLYATIHHLLASNLDDLAPLPKEASDGEENWVKVKYIKFPYYDDHFHIKDERFLLGKTLLMLGDAQSVDVPQNLRISLKIIGCGLYHKFPRGLELLQGIVQLADVQIPQSALDYFAERLDKVEARDPNEPEVELALRTVDDVIHRLLPTTEEKANFQAELAKLQEQLSSQGRLVADYDLGQKVQDFVMTNISQFETNDITAHLKCLTLWTEERKNELARQIEEYKRNTRIEEMRQQIKQLQEQEEILTYFDFEEKVRLAVGEEDGVSNRDLVISK